MSDTHISESYSAKEDYQHNEAAAGYEQRPYYRGFLGKYRKFRERQAIQSAVQQFMQDNVTLDCPCGNGRWFGVLSMRASQIIGMDISEVMAKAASEIHIKGINLKVNIGEAEDIDMEDNSVDHVFSYALMKHLPPEIKVKAISEFARVSTGRIAVSFGVFNPIGKLLWKIRGEHEWPVKWSEIKQLANIVSLDIGAIYKSSIPIVGMEHIVVFERKPV